MSRRILINFFMAFGIRLVFRDDFELSFVILMDKFFFLNL